MSPAEKNKSRAAEELAAEMETRENARIQAERRGLTDLNQGMEASGHEAAHPGIKWGPTFTKRRKAKAKKGAKSQK
ncbi:MAG TPA: hypothetical protein VNJ12_09725 [Candidatus Dormibacteraeota bacterium]|nr:hypothetical protein [Candidatus Dormibacteraeota bacterium]